MHIGSKIKSWGILTQCWHGRQAGTIKRISGWSALKDLTYPLTYTVRGLACQCQWDVCLYCRKRKREWSFLPSLQSFICSWWGSCMTHRPTKISRLTTGRTNTPDPSLSHSRMYILFSMLTQCVSGGYTVITSETLWSMLTWVKGAVYFQKLLLSLLSLNSMPWPPALRQWQSESLRISSSRPYHSV